MKQALLRIQRRLFIVTLLSFALTPVIGYTTAGFFNMVELKSLLTGDSGIVLIAIYSSLLLWCAIHFKNFLQPVIKWKLHHPDNNFLPGDLSAQLQSFGNRYWVFFLLLKKYGVDFAQGHYLGKPQSTIDSGKIIVADKVNGITYN